MLGSKKVLVSIVLAAAALTAALGGSALASATSPKIHARPHSVMVNTTTNLKGSGFPANTTIQLRECGNTFWLAPSYPCLEDNGVSVTTDAKGRFQTAFKVELCPEGEATKKPTRRVCYVGELVTEEDSGSLVGAARLIVTYP
jgi:hypothetical protein